MPTPLVTLISAEIASLLDGMTTAGGYYFDWDCVNPSMFDHTRITSYPCACVELLREVNNDNLDGINAQMYENDLEYKIDTFVQVDISALDPEESPMDYIDTEIHKVVADVKKLFGSYPGMCVSGKAFAAQYGGWEKRFTHDFEGPAWVEITLRVRYRQDRTDPSVQK